LISQGVPQLGGRQTTTVRWQKQVFIHTRLSRAYLALARLLVLTMSLPECQRSPTRKPRYVAGVLGLESTNIIHCKDSKKTNEWQYWKLPLSTAALSFDAPF